MEPGEENVDNGTAQAPAGAGATEVAPESQNAAPPVQPAAPAWKVGDTTYKSPEELAEAFKKFQGEYTRSRQEFSKLRDEREALQSIMNVIRSDPRLLDEVRARMQAGASKEQAVEDTARLHPEVRQALQELNELKAESLENKQTRAQEDFEKAHPDLSEEEFNGMQEWLGENAPWLEHFRKDPSKMIELAYNNVVLPKRIGRAVETGQRLKEEEIKKGKQSAFLGSQAPTAGAKAKPEGRPKGKMSPHEEREYARQIWEKSKAGK